MIIEDVVIEPASFRAGDIVTIRAKAVNDSRVNISERFEFTFKINGTRIGIFSVRLSPARQNRTFETTWEAVEGDHQLLIEVDRPRNQVIESNERNNTFQTTLSVAPDSNIISLTHLALDSQASAWQQASDALDFDISSSDNLFALLDFVKGGFNDFSKAMTSLVNRLDEVNAEWPGSFVEDNVYTPLLPHYQSITDATALINTSLEDLNLDGSVQGMRTIQEALNALAALSSDLLPLADLALASNTLGFAIDAVMEAQENFTEDGSAGDAIDTLLREVEDFGLILGDVARAFTQSTNQNTADLEDNQGETLRNLSPSTEVIITAPGANVVFEVIDSTGASILSLNAPSNSLNWSGTDNSGRPLLAETYFFRISWDGGAVADVGSMTVTE